MRLTFIVAVSLPFLAASDSCWLPLTRIPLTSYGSSANLTPSLILWVTPECMRHQWVHVSMSSLKPCSHEYLRSQHPLAMAQRHFMVLTQQPDESHCVTTCVTEAQTQWGWWPYCHHCIYPRADTHLLIQTHSQLWHLLEKPLHEALTTGNMKCIIIQYYM